MSDLIRGCDVSAVQGNINWQAVAAAGYQFVIVKCGEGNRGIDGMYARNVMGAQAAGLKVACYQFIYPLNPIPSQPLRAPILQAQYHFKATQGLVSTHFVDCEWPAPQDFNKWQVNSAQLNQWMLTYLQEYERLSGRKPGVYTYPWWSAAVKFDPQFAQYPLWIASYQAAPAVPHPWAPDRWVLWQNSGGTAKLPGTGTPVDTDLAKDLSIFDVSAPAPIVEPIPDHQPDPVPMVAAPVPVIVPAPVVSSPAIPQPLTAIWNFISNLFRH